MFVHARRRRRRAGEKGETGFSVELVQTSRVGDVPRPTTNPLVDSSTLLAPFLLAFSDGAAVSSFSRSESSAPRYTGLLQVGSSTPYLVASWNDARNGKTRVQFNFVSVFDEATPGDDFMPVGSGIAFR